MSNVAVTAAAASAHGERRATANAVSANDAASTMSNPTHATSQCSVVCFAGSRYPRKSVHGTSTIATTSSSRVTQRYGTSFTA